MPGGFNVDFDDADGQELIAIFQSAMGCFACEKKDDPNNHKTCSRCKVAKYCSKACQAKDWNKAHHKVLCGVWCENRSIDKTGRLPASIPICMKSCGFIPEDILMKEMKHRTDLFFQEIRNCDDAVSRLSFTTAVIYSVGAIRLVAEASFFSKSAARVLRVNHVLFETLVDEGEGEEARQRLYPSHGGSGVISNDAKNVVVEKWTEFIKRINENGLRVASITFGRGLMWLSDEEEAKEEMETHNGGCGIMWVPSMDYVVTDSMQDATQASFPNLAGLMNQFGRM